MNGFRKRLTISFFILASISFLIFGRSQNTLIEQIRAYVFDLFIPIITLVDIPRDATSNLSDRVRNIAMVFSDNRFLREENIELKRKLIESTELEIDNFRLKSLLNIKNGTLNTVTASRIVSDSNSPFFRSMLINSGTQANVKKGHAVVNEEGVIGRIINVAVNSSRVLLLNDINSRIPVKFVKNGINVILAGNNSRFLGINFMPEDVKAVNGDLILTSGMGGVFPPDLPVGVVVNVLATGEIKIEPAVNFDRLNYVSVIDYEIANFSELSEGQMENNKPSRLERSKQ
ncbi:MAG: rod shape-determining protein MreC [Kordiimonadaceae bacterium]|jgi:rod shape-determining protein MreC|nr:rod shape-determining protein MreC [Kordiimonadaceae bacterium]MDC0081641.1 rod shape-determining protein MreC [Emcibacteraceae bacterium]MBT6466769.1 rod shape-determining protein MreC [Kordiimonadaceae bacterium]MBT7543850.1 rod shape-determining protein MreC [Kordiimonadaceae bacterium]MBT7605380.1 rod shape-determining protein MreC [Kordiimonadaceae bacterium]|tara:strand:- start:37643 stop:38506 length:864 start_codon:yes stop_codon:yes gene_type:complete